jgi:hypothetical protein
MFVKFSYNAIKLFVFLVLHPFITVEQARGDHSREAGPPHNTFGFARNQL